LYRCGEIFTTQSDFLTGLDRDIGDADHGLNMHRGFSKVVEKLPSIADKDIGFILKNTGMVLLSNVGGASGPLFGTFFIRAAQVTQARQNLSVEELYLMIREGADGVVSRGKPNEVIKPCVTSGSRWRIHCVTPAKTIYQ
jgi:dihydroxyacetone kinase-like protein